MDNQILYKTNIWQMGNNTAIPVPEDILEILNAGKRPLVRVTVNHQYTYRSAVAVMDGEFLISLSKEHRNAAGVQGGDPVEIILELDTEARTVEIPADLNEALTKANAMQAFEKTAPSMKREYVRQVVEAKKQETRENRIEKIIEKLLAEKKKTYHSGWD